MRINFLVKLSLVVFLSLGLIHCGGSSNHSGSAGIAGGGGAGGIAGTGPNPNQTSRDLTVQEQQQAMSLILTSTTLSNAIFGNPSELSALEADDVSTGLICDECPYGGKLCISRSPIAAPPAVPGSPPLVPGADVETVLFNNCQVALHAGSLLESVRAGSSVSVLKYNGVVQFRRPQGGGRTNAYYDTRVSYGTGVWHIEGDGGTGGGAVGGAGGGEAGGQSGQAGQGAGPRVLLDGLVSSTECTMKGTSSSINNSNLAAFTFSADSNFNYRGTCSDGTYTHEGHLLSVYRGGDAFIVGHMNIWTPSNRPIACRYGTDYTCDPITSAALTSCTEREVARCNYYAEPTCQAEILATCREQNEDLCATENEDVQIPLYCGTSDMTAEQRRAFRNGVIENCTREAPPADLALCRAEQTQSCLDSIRPFCESESRQACSSAITSRTSGVFSLNFSDYRQACEAYKNACGLPSTAPCFGN